jgi:tetratricopeptide (TPR) repeat protein
MHDTMKNILLLCFNLAVFALQAQSAHDPLRKGDKNYSRQEYENAGKSYKDALTIDPNNQRANYNLGNSLYQQGKYEDAVKQYEQAAPSIKNPQEKADLMHNLGNAYLKQKKYKEAIDAYSNSLRLRPGDPQTKMNLQMAKKKILEQQKQDQPQNQPPKQGQDPQNQPPNQDQNQDQNQNKDQNQDQNQQPNQGSKPEQQKPQNPEKETTAPGKMSPEEAKRLLESAVGPEDKKNARKYREQAPDTKSKTNKKDW